MQANQRGIQMEIPGKGRLRIEVAVTDFSGTLSCGGRLTPGVGERLTRLSEKVDIHVLTSDTFSTAREALAGLPVTVHILEGERHDMQKRDYVTAIPDIARVFALGNGANDRLMLEAVRDGGGVALAVDNGEGCSMETVAAASLVIHGAANALELLLDPNRLKAVLRY